MIPVFCIDKTAVYLDEVEPTNEGKHRWFAYWYMKDFHEGPQWRGQIFNANLDEHIRDWKDVGKVIAIRDKGSSLFRLA